MLVDVLFVLDELIAEDLFKVPTDPLQLGHAIDCVSGEVKAVEVVHHRHIERRAGCTFFFVASNMQVVVVVTAIGQPVNQPRVSVICKDDRLVGGEQGIEVSVS